MVRTVLTAEDGADGVPLRRPKGGETKATLRRVRQCVSSVLPIIRRTRITSSATSFETGRALAERANRAMRDDERAGASLAC